MKNIKFFFLPLSFLTLFLNVKAQDVTANGALNNVLSVYYGVKNSLVADNDKQAQSKATDLAAAVSAVPLDNLSANQQEIWAAHKDKLLSECKHISEGKLEDQRNYFTALSQNMFEIFKGLKINTTQIYQQYCPMKKAIWLSEIPGIKNPYYGSQMLTCGNTTAILPVETHIK